MARYIVKIMTVDAHYAGTDSDVYVKLHKENAYIANPQLLDNWGNDFTPGSIANYQVDFDLPVGPIVGVTLYCDGSDEWQPNWVMVLDPADEMVWRADFSGVKLKNSYRYREAQLYSSGIDEAAFGGDGVLPRTRRLPSGDNVSNPASWRGLEEWTKSSVDAFGEMVSNAGGATDLIAIGLIQLLERSGMFGKFNYVTTGALFAGSAIVNTTVESGSLYRIERTATDLRLGKKIGPYLTWDFGVESGVGFEGGVTAGVWSPGDFSALRRYSFCRTLAIQAYGGIEVSWFWSADTWGQTSGFGNLLGVEIAFVAGLSVEVGAGVSWPYTWIFS